MKNIVISLNTGEVLADGKLDENEVLEHDQAFYFQKTNVNFTLLALEKKFSLKNPLSKNITVYSLPDKNSKPTGKIVAWIYENLENDLAKLNGRVGLKKTSQKEIIVQELYE